MNGRVAQQGNQWTDITPSMVDGPQLARLGKQSGVTVIETLRDVADLAAAEALIVVYKAMQGTLVDMFDQFGTLWDLTGGRPFAVLSVTTQKIDAIAKVGGVAVDGGPFVVQARWELRHLLTL